MADDGILKVNFAQMSNVPGAIDNAIRNMNSTLEDLQRAAAPIVESWGGDARTEYDTRQKLWTDAQTDLTTLLGQVKKAVETAMENYARTEAQNAARFGR